MDDTDQKIEVQKASATVILHSTTEAAERIMLAERKAAKFEFELKESKEISSHMLMNMKQMMDSKMKEAAIKSRFQQKKIEELEAELAEAKNLVKHLSEELSSVQGGSKMTSPNDSSSFLSPVKHQPIRFANSQNDESNKCSKVNRSNSLFPIVGPTDYQNSPAAIIPRKRRTERYVSGCERDNNSKSGYLKLKANKEVDKLIRCSSVISNEKGKKKKLLFDSFMEKDTSLPIIPFDHDQAVNSSLSSTTSVACLESVVDVSRRIQGDKEEFLCLEHEKTKVPLSSETQVDCLKLRTNLVTEGIVSRPKSGVIKYTFERKRKRGSLDMDGGNLSDKLKKNESNESVLLESEKVNSKGKSTEEKTEKVVLDDESTDEENLELMVAAELLTLKSRLKSLSGKK